VFRSDQLGLCCGSLVQADFRGLAEAAGTAGFKSISAWPTLFYGALDSGLSEADLRSILADNGLHITELDPLMSWLPLELDDSDMAAGLLSYSEDHFYRIADELGARSLNLIQQGDSPASNSERIDLISGICERAKAHGLLVSVEFLPWSPIGNLQSALELVAAVAKDNFGVNIDIWHHFRSGGTTEQLAIVDPNRVVALQFNDVAEQPWGNIVEETSMGRLLPGEGSSNSAAVLGALEQAGVDAPLNVEVFSAELMSLPAVEAAKRLFTSTQRVIENAGM
jgi:sugar phosphate isomerase/epimerase